MFSETGGRYIQQGVAVDMDVGVTVENNAAGNNNQILQATGSDVNFVLTLSFSNSIQDSFYTSQSIALTTAQEQSALAPGKCIKPSCHYTIGNTCELFRRQKQLDALTFISSRCHSSVTFAHILIL